MEPTVDPTSPLAGLPEDVLRSSSGEPAVLLVRTARGWTVLSPVGADLPREGLPGTGAHTQTDELGLVEAMSLADLVAGEVGATPEPDRRARRAARTTAASPSTEDQPADPRDVELASLRRTVGQLEHALAARVSIERAIGVLAERHGTTPREAFEELRGRARSQGRPAAELAAEVLDGLPTRAAVPGQRGALARPSAGPRAAAPQASPRRVQRGRRPAEEGTLPEARN